MIVANLSQNMLCFMNFNNKPFYKIKKTVPKQMIHLVNNLIHTKNQQCFLQKIKNVSFNSGNFEIRLLIYPFYRQVAPPYAYIICGCRTKFSILWLIVMSFAYKTTIKKLMIKWSFILLHRDSNCLPESWCCLLQNSRSTTKTSCILCLTRFIT